MIRFLTAALLAVAAITAPTALADPNNLVPECTGGQVPEPGQCNASPLDGLFGDAPGGNPNTQTGLTPQLQPVVAPLGLTPGNLPVLLPLGVTPPNVVTGR